MNESNIKVPGKRREKFGPSKHEQVPFGVAAPRLGRLFQTPPQSTAYNSGVAYLASVVSAWAYADGQMLADKLPYYGLPACTVEEIAVVNDALCVVAHAFFVRSKDGRVAVLAFRGTEPANFVNWLTDANTITRSWHPRGQVHSGFFANVEAVWTDLAELLAASDRLESLYVTGHSLGAAMAVLAAGRIFQDRSVAEKVRGVYTFGQPMVGDAEFAEICKDVGLAKMLYRHVNSADVVPHLPPRSFGPFVHFGDAYSLGKDAKGDRVWNKSDAVTSQAWFLGPALAASAGSFVSRRMHALRGVRFGYSLDDHSPGPYVEVSRASVPRAEIATAPTTLQQAREAQVS
jgi:hypothetical protein